MKPILSRILLGIALLCSAQIQAQLVFTDADIGSPASPGSCVVTGSTYTVTGGGTDIWGTGDQFNYYYASLVGSFDVKVRVTTLTNSPTTDYANAWVKAELMARLDDGTGIPNAGDPFIASMTTRSNTAASGNRQASQNEVNVQYRQVRNGGANWPGTPPNYWLPAKLTPTYPNTWLRLIRIGNLFYSYSSTDNTNWTLLYPADTANDPAWNAPDGAGTGPWASSVLIGLGVTSHDNTAGRTAYGTFDNLTFVSGLLALPSGTRTGFSLQAGITGGADYITNITVLKMDGSNMLSLVTSSNTGTLPVTTSVLYAGTSNFVAGSSHKVDMTVQTYFGQTLSVTGVPFVTPTYFIAPTNLVVDLANINTNLSGFTVKSWRTPHTYNANVFRFAEETAIGLRGINGADQTGADASDSFAWTNMLNFHNGVGGFFSTSNTNLQYALADSDFSSFGLPNGSETYSTVEFFTYMYFPTSGVYQIYVASDDAFYLTASQNPFDRMGIPAMSFPVAQEPSSPTAYNISWVINQPGAYPFRLLLENGTGGMGLEVYASYTMGGTNSYILVNDPGDDGSVSGIPRPASPIKCYQATASSVAGAYVKKANPVRDGQNVVFYQPIVVDLGDGVGGRTVNPTTNNNNILLKVDNVAQTLAVTKSGDTTHVALQMGTNTWNLGAHTILLTFSDNAGTNYSYTWPFTVLSIVPTNSPVTTVPSTVMVSTNTIDFNQPGFRIRSYQTIANTPNRHGWTEEQMEGLRGANLASSGIDYYTWSDMLDFASNGGATCEWNFNNSFNIFGIHNALPFWDNCSLEIGAWLVFPKAGTYMMHVNSDDGWQVSFPLGFPFNKLGTVVGLRDAGSSTGGPNNGAFVGNAVQYFNFSIPAPGAYPVRLLWENGTGGLALEWSIYQYLPDGGIAKVAINDQSQPYAIMAYQTTTQGDMLNPYVKYLNPAADTENAVFYQPVVVDLADSPSRTVDTNTLSLVVDSLAQTIAVTKSNDVTHIIQQMSSFWQNGFHTNVLTYADNLGLKYTNTWRFSVINVRAFGVITLTNMVPTSTVDHNRPGFLVRSYQTTAANTGSSIYSDETFEGLHGANIADQTNATNEFGSFVWQDVMDFGGNGTTYGDWGYDSYIYGGMYFGGIANRGMILANFGLTGTPPATNYFQLDFGAWLEFKQAGYYTMHVNVDDGFRVISPAGNPLNRVGTYLAARDGTGGQSGPSGAQTGGTYFTIYIPASGAYPFRLLWANVTGGFGLEWSVYQHLDNGGVAKILINDTNNPAAVLAYQVSSASSPYLKSIIPVPASLAGAGPVMTLGSGSIGTSDLSLDLVDGSAFVNTSSVVLSFNGATQPITITQPALGQTHIVRYATNFWPSGAFGPLTLTYSDSLGRQYSTVWNIATSFWGTLTNGLPLGVGDTNKPGYKLRLYQLDNPVLITAPATNTTMPTRIHVAEQVLAGMWGANVAQLTNLNEAPYWYRTGTGPTNGTINNNIPGQAQAGSFQSAAGYPDVLFPGLPGAVTSTVNGTPGNNFADEFLMYIEFPTNGTYTLAVNSDDGFRVTSGWTRPANIGALQISAPAALAGFKPTVQDTFLTSYPLTNAVSGQLVLANGIGYGSTTNGEGCIISNPSALAGNIAVMYRSGSCGYLQQVQNALAAGAIGVVLIQNRTNTEGPFPQEPGVTPMQAIPAVEIEQVDGNALVAILATNGVVNGTVTPMDYLINPPPQNPVLGESDTGKGSSDVAFPVVVQQAGTYPVRLVHYQGGGGGNCEFFSYVGSTKVLINDLTQNGLKAFYGIQSNAPTISEAVVAGHIVITFTGTLQSSSSLTPGSFTDVAGNPASPYTVPAGGPVQFYRARVAQ
jgi:hypothetical protein